MEFLILIGLIVIIVLQLINKNSNAANEIAKISTFLADLKLTLSNEFANNRRDNSAAFKETREEIVNSFTKLSDNLSNNITNLRTELTNALQSFEKQFISYINGYSDLLTTEFEKFNNRQDAIRKETEEKLKEIRETVETKLFKIQEENSIKLEEMRKTVDEKLQETVEKRFNQSFQMISERLEQVHKGLGEMQNLAAGVGDLKKVLTNVKTRGNLGEIQLGAILEQILSPEQYEKNVAVKAKSQERVEYAIKIPSKQEDGKFIYLPIDSKFPIEDYQRLLDAYDNVGDMSPKDFEAISKNFENSIKKNAKDIKEKYIEPPNTTDFAIMFVPTEGLYAEILRRNGLFETLQKEFKVTVVGPANLAAFLNSLQMGFRTLAIEKRSSEVWEILGAIKTEFGKFGDLLEKTKKKLQEATNVIDDAGKKTRTIERKLKDVQALPAEKSQILLGTTIDDVDDGN
jgi:DNA recombination protein RmuC